ncbi:conserved hypothetical protein [Methylocella tundrae]|uniref:Proteophosphoglycan n=1 Tax=Methylocella tundrae TaxID=227605 RepID=A0A8B6M4I3_METTU|nr:DUF1285 domain-containing protein [Methylocella tundrae]VTZ28407.1 conserved hypothetical protein [Methylocella tundrae]VTZ49921.1 conserved hypothetical protein [Methylocella tundrae]
MAQDIEAKGEPERQDPPALARLARELPAPGQARPLPPVAQWNPPFCGDIDMRIARDGAWFYQGTPILRPALVRLFSTILRKDPDRYVLVTPVERVGILVEDAPFIAVEMEKSGDGPEQLLRFRTNVDDWVTADAEHPLRFERETESGGVKPYVLVRGELWALLARALLMDLVALCEIRAHEGAQCFGVASAGAFFPLAGAQELAAIEASL